MTTPLNEQELKEIERYLNGEGAWTDILPPNENIWDVIRRLLATIRALQVEQNRILLMCEEDQKVIISEREEVKRLQELEIELHKLKFPDAGKDWGHVD